MRGSLIIAALLVAAWPAGASVIVTQSGTYAGSENAVSYASWTQTSAWSNVSISASLFSTDATATGNAYLTTQVGTGATIATQIATTPISINNSTPQATTLFSGLTLNPGTYYLVINPTNDSLAWAGVFSSTPTVTLGSGVTANDDFSSFDPANAYPPATNFSVGGDKGTRLLYSVTGTQGASVPTLSTWALLGTVLLLGLSGMMLVSRYRQTA